MSIGLIMVKLLSGFIALIFCMKLTGAKGVSNLTPIDFIWSIMLSEIFGNGIYDPEVKWHVVLLTLIVWCLLKVLFDRILFHTDKLEDFITGERVLIIRDGNIDRQMLRKNTLDLKDLHHALRKQGIFSVDEIKCAYLEKDGSVSVQKKPAFEPVSKGDLDVD